MTKLINSSLVSKKQFTHSQSNFHHIRNKKKLYFDVPVPSRLSHEMVSLMDSFISTLKDTEGNPLFSSRSHFIKCSLVHHFKHLKNVYPSLSSLDVDKIKN